LGASATLSHTGESTFSSDSPDPQFVSLIVEDYYPKASTPRWRASITAADLQSFCERLRELVEETIG
jgi:hypothetical protein